MNHSESIVNLRELKRRLLDDARPHAVEKQHELGKLTVRERIALLFDEGTFVEMGGLVDRHAGKMRAPDGRDSTCDGVVVGHGLIDGRPAVCAASDFTVFGGSIGRLSETKLWRMRRFALRSRIPMIYLLEGGGARIQETLTSKEGYNPMFLDMVGMSGLVPTVGAAVGPCFAGHANIAGVCDFVPMVKGTSSMGVAGPELVRTSVGEKVTKEQLGGSKLHTHLTGMAHLEVADDRECMEAIRKFLSYLPGNCDELPPRKEPTDDPDRREEKLIDIVPDDPRRPYDMKDVITAIVDNGEVFDIQPRHAAHAITVFARMDGFSVGIVANQPAVLAGAIDLRASDKISHFINLCDAFNVPLIFLQDVPGVIGGTRSEKEGIVRHCAKIAFELAMATVPKFTVVVRKAYGLGHYVMCASGFDPDLIVTWPSADLASMGPEGAVEILFRNELAEHPNPEELRAHLVAKAKLGMGPITGAKWAVFDDVIDPRNTRPTLIRAVRAAMRRDWFHNKRKRGVTPI